MKIVAVLGLVAGVQGAAVKSWENFATMNSCVRVVGTSYAGEYRPTGELHNGQFIWEKQGDATKVFQYNGGSWDMCARSGSSGRSPCGGSSGRAGNIGDITYMGSIYNWSGQSMYTTFCNLGTDIASGRPVTMSTNYGNGWTPDKLTDGNHNTGVHSVAGNGETNPWAQVDLGSSKDVSVVRILNRAGSCASRLFGGLPCQWENHGNTWTGSHQGAVIRISDSPCSGDVCPNSFQCDIWQKSRGHHWYEANCAGRTGRYVSIMLRGPGRMMNIMELEAFSDSFNQLNAAEPNDRSGYMQVGQSAGQSYLVNNQPYHASQDNGDGGWAQYSFNCLYARNGQDIGFHVDGNGGTSDSHFLRYNHGNSFVFHQGSGNRWSTTGIDGGSRTMMNVVQGRNDIFVMGRENDSKIYRIALPYGCSPVEGTLPSPAPVVSTLQAELNAYCHTNYGRFGRTQARNDVGNSGQTTASWRCYDVRELDFGATSGNCASNCGGSADCTGKVQGTSTDHSSTSALGDLVASRKDALCDTAAPTPNPTTALQGFQFSQGQAGLSNVEYGVDDNDNVYKCEFDDCMMSASSDRSTWLVVDRPADVAWSMGYGLDTSDASWSVDPDKIVIVADNGDVYEFPHSCQC